MNEFAAAFLRSFPLADRRPVTVWAADGNVKIPHSKRCPDFREDTAYWINEPLNATQTCEAVSVCKPTQGSGTTLEEVFLAHTVATHPRDTHFMAQTDPDAESIFRKKLLRTLRTSPATAPILATAGRNDITKNRMELPTMDLAVHGPGANSMQSDSVEVLLLDEAWRYDLGTIGEILERTSTVEATRKIVTVSQAGEELEDESGRAMMDEWGQWWHQGTQEEYRVACPSCGHRYYPLTSHFIGRDDERDPDTKVWNWSKVRENTHHVTPCCGHEIENTPENRRSFSASGQYIQTNFNAATGHRSFVYSSWIVYWQDWGRLREQFLRAQDALHAGDFAPLKIWTQKKEARWWTLKDKAPLIINTKSASGYRIETYERTPEMPETPRIPNEERRFGGIDFQRDRFPLIVKAFGGGRSRVLTYEEPQTIEDVNELMKQYDVPSHMVGFDVGNWSKDAMRFCWQYKWTPLRGRDISNFTKTRGKRVPVRTRYQAVLERLTGDKIYGAGANLKVWEWSNTYFKDIFSRLRAMPEHEIPDDIGQIYIEGMESEAKNPKTGIWKQIGKRPNHPWDCESMVTFMAFLYKLVGAPEDQEEPEDAEAH